MTWRFLTGEGSFSLMLSDDSGNSLTAEGNIIFIGNGTAIGDLKWRVLRNSVGLDLL